MKKNRIFHGGGPFIKMTDEMNQNLHVIGYDNTCAANAAHYLGFPSSIVSHIVSSASTGQGTGVSNKLVLDEIRKYENLFQNTQLSKESQACLYNSNNFTQCKELNNSDVENLEYSDLRQNFFTSDKRDTAINTIFDSLPKGYATFLGFGRSNGTGHYVVIAKDINDIAFIIDPMIQRNYRGIEIIKQYLKLQNVVWFITFSYGKKIDASSEDWNSVKHSSSQGDSYVSMPYCSDVNPVAYPSRYASDPRRRVSRVYPPTQAPAPAPAPAQAQAQSGDGYLFINPTPRGGFQSKTTKKKKIKNRIKKHKKKQSTKKNNTRNRNKKHNKKQFTKKNNYIFEDLYM